ncbi:MAG: peptidase U32 family protein [Bacillota bacterium]|jgi:putative protease
MIKKPELLAPAGDLEKLKMAVLYGADAVYIGGQNFSLRERATNFDDAQMREAVDFAHARGVRVYVTINIYAHNEHIEQMADYMKNLAEMKVDAFIVSDPGVFALAKRTVPGMELHISTQASVTNYEAVEFWRQAGASRVILAREVSLYDCGVISRHTDTDLEIFVHGAVCMSYSGRCLLSSFMTKRSGNLGDCAQPCRWQYRLEEAKRPGSYFPIEEDKWGSYIFNSKDLCLIDLLPEILFRGVASLKIEGRMKSAYYVANVVRVYREAVDSCYEAIEQFLRDNKQSAAECPTEIDFVKFKNEYFQVKEEWHEELQKISHRHYFTGFAVSKPNENGYIYDTTYSFRGYDFAGVVLDSADGKIKIQQRNHLALGDEVEIISPNQPVYKMCLEDIQDEDGGIREVLNHPKEIAWVKCEQAFSAGSIIRRPIKDENLKEMNKIHE